MSTAGIAALLAQAVAGQTQAAAGQTPPQPSGPPVQPAPAAPTVVPLLPPLPSTLSSPILLATSPPTSSPVPASAAPLFTPAPASPFATAPAAAGGTSGGTGTGGTGTAAGNPFGATVASIDERRAALERQAAQGNVYQDEFFALYEANERLAIARSVYEIATGSRQADIRALKGVAQGWNQV